MGTAHSDGVRTAETLEDVWAGAPDDVIIVGRKGTIMPMEPSFGRESTWIQCDALYSGGTPGGLITRLEPMSYCSVRCCRYPRISRQRIPGRWRGLSKPDC